MAARVIVFAKAPVPGRVKTRLIPALGPEGAAALARRMLERTLGEALATGMAVELCGDPDPGEWHDGPGVALEAQGAGDLGERLTRAAKRVLSAGDDVILIGTDCPALDAARLGDAARALGRFDAVINPTLDGGYALLGLSRFDPSIFAGIDWSTDRVAGQTVGRLVALGWTVAVGETLRDIDEPADLEVMER